MFILSIVGASTIIPRKAGDVKMGIASGRGNHTTSMVYWTMINPQARKGDVSIGVLARRFPEAQLTPYPSTEEAEALVVCGGDGTLRRALNLPLPKDLYYLPCGTVNDRGHLPQGPLTVGSTQLGRFGYVFAWGTLTDIGYNTRRSAKRHWGRLAYLAKAVGSFRVRRLQATLTAGGITQSGEYTLLMLLVGRRCFGFDFVKDEREDGAYLLTVSAPRSKGLGGLLTLFGRYARVFLLHIPPGYRRHGICLLPVERAHITLEHPVPWCVDGDKLITDVVRFERTPLPVNLHILPRKQKSPRPKDKGISE